MTDTGELKYLVLADRGLPYLLARVRFPDVAQAMSAARPDWLDDPGLFDLPYDPSSVAVSFAQAASVAAGWGRRLQAEPAAAVPSYIRRMPANWSDLSRSERRTWGIEFAGRGRTPSRRLPRLQLLRTKITGSSAAAQANGQTASLTGVSDAPDPSFDAPTVAHPIWTNGNGQLAEPISRPASGATERRAHVRVRLDGRAYIRCDDTTISAGLVDLGERGVHCILPDAPPLIALGARLRGPFLLEAEAHAVPICLDVSGQISWRRSIGSAAHFGVVFDELAPDETKGVQWFLTSVNGKRAQR